MPVGKERRRRVARSAPAGLEPVPEAIRSETQGTTSEFSHSRVTIEHAEAIVSGNTAGEIPTENCYQSSPTMRSTGRPLSSTACSGPKSRNPAYGNDCANLRLSDPLGGWLAEPRWHRHHQQLVVPSRPRRAGRGAFAQELWVFAAARARFGPYSGEPVCKGDAVFAGWNTSADGKIDMFVTASPVR